LHKNSEGGDTRVVRARVTFAGPAAA